MSVFEPGMMVVCVNTKPMPDCNNKYLHLIKEGNIYTIQKMIAGRIDKEPGVALEEIQLPDDPIFGEVGYHHRRLRPCRPTSIEIFEKILLNASVTEDA